MKVLEDITGTGATATGKMHVRLRLRFFLSRGEEIHFEEPWDDEIIFQLGNREYLAGVRYAVEGMREGGKRTILIPPHLAYGEQGIEGLVPANAVLRAEIELLETRGEDERFPLPSAQTAGKQLSVRARGEEASEYPRWSLVFYDRDHPHYPSKCTLLLSWSTRTDGKWGSDSKNLNRNVPIDVTPSEIEWMIDAAIRLPAEFPEECLGHDEVHGHGGHSPTRSNRDSSICVHIALVENGEWSSVAYIPESARVWQDSEWGRKVMAVAQPHLTPSSWRSDKVPPA